MSFYLYFSFIFVFHIQRLSELEDVSVGLSFNELARLTRVTTYDKVSYRLYNTQT